MYVGTLTAYEITFAGIKYGVANFDNYLMNDNSLFKEYNWTISLFYFSIYSVTDFWYAYTFASHSLGYLYESSSSNYYGVHPSINIKSNVEINDGDGTISNPYTIK